MSQKEKPSAEIDMSKFSWQQFTTAYESFKSQLFAHAKNGVIPDLHRQGKWSAKCTLGTGLHWRIALKRDDIADKVFTMELCKGDHRYPILASYLCQASVFQESYNYGVYSLDPGVNGIDIIDIAVKNFKNLFCNKMYNLFTRNCQDYVNAVLTDLGIERYVTSTDMAGGMAGGVVVPAIVVLMFQLLLKLLRLQ